MEADPQLGLHASGHEGSDASVPAVVYTLVGLAVGAVLVGFLVYGIFWYLAAHPLAAPVVNPMASTTPVLPPAPRIEDHPAVEVQELRSSEDKLLSTYGWTDKSKGIVRIPIDRAMELQLQRGFPVKKAGK